MCAGPAKHRYSIWQCFFFKEVEGSLLFDGKLKLDN